MAPKDVRGAEISVQGRPQSWPEKVCARQIGELYARGAEWLITTTQSNQTSQEGAK